MKTHLALLLIITSSFVFGNEARADTVEFLALIRRSDEAAATLLIKENSQIIKELSENINWETKWYLEKLSVELLDQLLANGLDAKLHASIIVQRVKTGLMDKKIDQVKSLLDSAIITDENKDAWLEGLKYPSITEVAHNLPELVLPLLQFEKKHGLQSIEHCRTLAEIIKKCDEETAIFAVTYYSELVPQLGREIATNAYAQNPKTGRYELIPDSNFLKKMPTNLIVLLIEKGCENILTQLTLLDNGIEVLEQLMQKNSSFILEHPELEDLILDTVLEGHLEMLNILSKHGVELKTVLKNSTELEEKYLLYAVKSTKKGSNDMLNYILDILDVHGNPVVLASAAGINNNILFNQLLEKGYAADPDPMAQSNLDGFALAIQSGNIQTINYYLERSVDPNTSIQLKEYNLPENIEVIELLIEHGLKIGLFHVAAAAENGSLEVIKYFKEKGYNTGHPSIFVAACSGGNTELIDFLLENGANINDPNTLVSAVRVDRDKYNSINIVQHLVEKGANPDNLMALNEALKTWDAELKIANYLVGKGARVDNRCVISAGLNGYPQALKWAIGETGMTITAELETIINSNSQDGVTKYTLDNLVPRDAILIGVSHYSFSFTDGILRVIAKLMEENSRVYVVPISDKIASDDSMMIRFSGFINPGAADSYPKLTEFSLAEMNKERMFDEERVYQKVISFARKHDIPYLGICAGSQHLSLNSEGYLQPVKDHGEIITIHFEKGSILHFMTLLPHERAKALQECQLNDVSADNAQVVHGFAAVKDKLGKNVKLGAISGKNENVPEAVYYGHNLVGVQFHPERSYFNEEEGDKTNRHKVLLDSFFENSLDYQKSRRYALEYGFHYTEVKDSIYNANQKLVNHLESCAKDPEYSRKDHFWGKNLGSQEISSDKVKDGVVNILTGLTAKDVGLARDGDDLILIIKSTGEMLSIESHFSEDGEHRVKSIDFADGSCLILNNDVTLQNGSSIHLDAHENYYRNATGIVNN